MSTAESKDGTRIAFFRTGDGRAAKRNPNLTRH